MSVFITTVVYIVLGAVFGLKESTFLFLDDSWLLNLGQNPGHTRYAVVKASLIKSMNIVEEKIFINSGGYTPFPDLFDHLMLYEPANRAMQEY